MKGTLTIGYVDKDGVDHHQDIVLSAKMVDNVDILTEQMEDGVKYVPYSYLLQTNNKYGGDTVSFTVRHMNDGEIEEAILRHWLNQQHSEGNHLEINNYKALYDDQYDDSWEQEEEKSQEEED